jgi:uncharacterized protein (TIGR00730 family)
LIKSVCVFCGAGKGGDPVYVREAQAFGQALARRGLGLVFGGGHIGLMGVVADAVLEAGGSATGVIPKAMVDQELAHRGLTRLEVVRTMHERKARMADLSDAVVALPGGYGTLDEFFEAVTWAQLGLHAKPIGILNTGGYFDGLVKFLDQAVQEGFVPAEHRVLFTVNKEAAVLLDALMGSGQRNRVRKVNEEDL